MRLQLEPGCGLADPPGGCRKWLTVRRVSTHHVTPSLIGTVLSERMTHQDPPSTPSDWTNVVCRLDVSIGTGYHDAS